MQTLRRTFLLLVLGLASVLMVGSLAWASGDHDGGHDDATEEQHETAPPADHMDDHMDDHGDEHHHGSTEGNLEDYEADVTYTLRTSIVDGGLAYVGVGGEIDGIVNPTLHAHHGEVLEIVLIDGDGLEHDFHLPAQEAMSDHVEGVGTETRFAFRAGEEGEYEYMCMVLGHREAGMLGVLEVAPGHD